MIPKIIICILALATMNVCANTLELDAIEISTSGGSAVTLSLDGSIQSVTLPAGAIKSDSDGNIKSVGGAVIKWDSDGKLRTIGGAAIKWESDGKLKSVGGTVIKWESDGKLKSVGGSAIKRDPDGNIESVEENSDGSVKPIFKLVTK